GMLVDNAIIVIENIFRLRQLNLGKEESAVKGTSEVGPAILASTLTTIVVFLPIVFIHGIAGELFKEGAWTVAFSLFSSLIVALIFIPMLAARYLKIKTAEEKIPFERPKRVYRPVIKKSLENKKYVIALALLLMIVSALLIPVIGNEFLPRAYQNRFTIKISLPEGVKFERTESVAGFTENVLMELAGEEIEMLYTHIGGSEGYALEEEIGGENRASIDVILKRSRNSKLTAQGLADDVSRYISQIPEVDVSFLFHQSTLQSALGKEEPPILLEIKGSELSTLREITGEISTLLGGMDALYNLKTSFQKGRPEINIVPDPMLLSNFGLDVETLARMIRQNISGEKAGWFRDAGGEKELVLKFPTRNLNDLKLMKLELESGAKINLQDIAEFRIEEGPREILRREQSRIAEISAEVVQGVKLSNVVKEIRDIIKNTPVPEGYRISLAGEERYRMESFSKMKFALILAVVLVYMVLAAQFESLIHPFTIILTLPFAGIGTVLLFFIINIPFNVMTYIGIVMLAGIAVNDSIILVDLINRLRRSGMEKRAAIVQAGLERLRPILMTSVTTIAALLPLSLGIGEQASLRSPMALAIIGGLITSTILTLIVIPVIYDLFDRLKFDII
ncbi:MAG: efflux RND transporter permease subunit, partial [Fidelibacterota bacterium]